MYIQTSYIVEKSTDLINYELHVYTIPENNLIKYKPQVTPTVLK